MGESRWRNAILAIDGIVPCNYEPQSAKKHYNLVDFMHLTPDIRTSFSFHVCVLSMFKGDNMILQVTSTSVDHMICFGDAAGRVQECGIYFYGFTSSSSVVDVLTSIVFLLFCLLFVHYLFNRLRMTVFKFTLDPTNVVLR